MLLYLIGFLMQNVPSVFSALIDTIIKGERRRVLIVKLT